MQNGNNPMQNGTSNTPTDQAEGRDPRHDMFQNVTSLTDQQILAEASEWLGYDAVFLPFGDLDWIRAHADLMVATYGDGASHCWISYDDEPMMRWELGQLVYYNPDARPHWEEHVVDDEHGEFLFPLTQHCPGHTAQGMLTNPVWKRYIGRGPEISAEDHKAADRERARRVRAGIAGQ